MNLKDLAKPFPAKDIEWRVGRCGEANGKVWAMVLAYLNARAVMDRLDEVVGPHMWRDRYWTEGKAVMCGLSIRVGDEWIEKVDGAEETDIEAVKGGLSGALKRAAVKWGIGRYLYNLEEGFANVVPQSREANFAKTKEGKAFYWLPPELPDWALPPIPEGTPESKGAKVSPLKAVSDDPGAFVVTIGKKYVGARLDEIGLADVRSYLGWLKEAGNKSGRAPTAEDKKNLDAMAAFVESREKQKAAAEGIPAQQNQ